MSSSIPGRVVSQSRFYTVRSSITYYTYLVEFLLTEPLVLRLGGEAVLGVAGVGQVVPGAGENGPAGDHRTLVPALPLARPEHQHYQQQHSCTAVLPWLENWIPHFLLLTPAHQNCHKLHKNNRGQWENAETSLKDSFHHLQQ